MLGRACSVVLGGMADIFSPSEPGGQSLGLASRTPRFLCELQAPSNFWVASNRTQRSWGSQRPCWAVAWLQHGFLSPETSSVTGLISSLSP